MRISDWSSVVCSSDLHGWRDIVNDVIQDVDQRAQNADLTAVWSTESPFSILTGQTVEIKAVASDPFLNAVAPTASGDDPDIVYTGSGTVSTTITDRKSVV